MGCGPGLRRRRGLGILARALARRLDIEAALAALAAAAAAFVALLATADPGPTVTQDSVDYLATAGSLAAGDGLANFDGQALVLFPPGFPAAVAVLAWAFGLDPLDAARVVNAAALAGIVLCGWLLLRRHVELAGLRAAGVLAIAFGAPVAVIATAAWSEPLFVLAVLGALVLVESAVARPRAIGWVVAAALCAAVAFYARHVGVAVIAAGALALLVGPGLPRRARLGRATLFAGLAAALGAVWIARNLALTGEPVGDRLEGGVGPGQALEDAVGAMSSWFLPNALPLGLRAALLAAALVALAWGARATLSRERLRALTPLALFAAIFVGLMTLSAVGTELDRLDDRLLAPAYVPGVVLALAALDGIARRAPERHHAIAVAAVAAAATAALFTAFTGAKSIRDVARDGGAYTEARWQGSALFAELREAPAGELAFSNRARPAAFVADRDVGCWPGEPGLTCKGSANRPLAIAAMVRRAGGGLVAWSLPPAGRPRPPAPPGLRLRVVTRADDGALYRAEPVSRPASARSRP